MENVIVDCCVDRLWKMCFCQDMVKFGDTGRAKQTCLMPQRLRPMFPVTAACKFCSLDSWGHSPAPLMGKQVQQHLLKQERGNFHYQMILRPLMNLIQKKQWHLVKK